MKITANELILFLMMAAMVIAISDKFDSIEDRLSKVEVVAYPILLNYK